jgi:hypothetical protein
MSAKQLSTIGKHRAFTFFPHGEIKPNAKPLKREFKRPLIFWANRLSRREPIGQVASGQSSARIDLTGKAIGALTSRNIHSDDRASLANRRA